jgi:hypothetical protein
MANLSRRAGNLQNLREGFESGAVSSGCEHADNNSTEKPYKVKHRSKRSVYYRG